MNHGQHKAALNLRQFFHFRLYPSQPPDFFLEVFDPLRLALQSLVVQFSIHDFQEEPRGKGFSNKIMGSLTHGLDREFNGCISGDDDTDQLRVQLSDVMEHFQSAHPRHHGIQQENIKSPFLEFVQTGGAIFSHFHFKPLGGEGPLAPLPDPQFIVYDKNTHRLPSLNVISLVRSGSAKLG